MRQSSGEAPSLRIRVTRAGQAQLKHDFMSNLMQLACVYYILEENFVDTASLDIVSLQGWSFPLLTFLYNNLHKSVRPFDDNPEFAEQKRDHILAFRAAVGKYVLQAPFSSHAFRKPHGYPGDFEMMEMLYDSAEGGPNPFGRFLQAHFMGGPGPASVRSRRKYLAGILVERANACRADQTLRVLNVGCGPAREVQDLFGVTANRKIEMTLVDQDNEALVHAEKSLRATKAAQHQVHLMAMSARSILEREYAIGGPFDIIYSTGLYDYLRASFAKRFTQRLLELLVQGGELIIANYSRENMNPDRFFVEYALDWFLITRTREEMRELVQSAFVSDVQVAFDEATNSIYFLHARKSR